MTDRNPARIGLIILPALLLVLAAGDADAREVVPAPADGGPGLSELPEDNAPPYRPSRPELRGREPRPAAADLKSRGYDTIGGDDVLIAEGDWLTDACLDIADNGDIYVAYTDVPSGAGHRIIVERSTDGGDTFQQWGVLTPPGDDHYLDPDIQVVEGSIDALLIVFEHDTLSGDDDIVLASSPLGASASFGPLVTVMSYGGVTFFHPRFDTDVDSYSAFYVYVVASGADGTGWDVWFSRSTNQGNSFETPYPLASLSVDDRAYEYPDISYGYGNHLHVSWQLAYDTGPSDSSVRYRRASNWANGGLSDWDYWVTMTSNSDGYDDQRTVIHGGEASDDVVLAYHRIDVDLDIYVDTRVFVSDDAGATFAPSTAILFDAGYPGDMVENDVAGTWTFGALLFSGYGLSRAPSTDLTAWTYKDQFSEGFGTSYWWIRPDVALDPSRDNRAAMAWTLGYVDQPDRIMFDAEWRSDPGYPNLEDGFPLGLWAQPLSPPALVDVDGDPELEIVFSDVIRQVHVLNPDGSSVPGWPVDVGVDLSDGPVAVGDLDGDGVPTLVVGGTDGYAYAFEPDGTPKPGWPVEANGTPGDVYVSIGALGPPFPRSVVTACGPLVQIRDHRGRWQGGMAYGSTAIAAPAAIGDIDDDGTAEFVYGAGYALYARERDAVTAEVLTITPALLSDALSMADLDFDGDLEILWPGQDGVLYAYDHDGNPLGGNFPYDTGDANALTSAAIAQFRGAYEPDIAFGHHDWTVHALYNDGSPMPGYPVNTTNLWYVYGAPVIGPVNGYPSDVIIADRGRAAWSWNSSGNLLDGWPKDMENRVNLSPATADIDNDGSLEIVVLSETQVFVMDVNAAPFLAGYTWPMYGHDPQRTGCADCPEDLATAADPAAGVTRVSFAGATPNPVSGATSFAFAVPRRAAVDLEIVDLRGRRVYTVFREEMEPGERVVGWTGCDRDGRPVPSGQYFARLRARGPGLDETLTRKLTVVR